MASTDYTSYIFAIIVLLGGIIGYAKKGSIPSLAAGVVFSAILAYGASRSSANSRDVGVLLVASLILAFVMGSRFFKTGKFMPAGLVFILSVGNLIRNAYIYKQS
ncbi:transmembrane protein 14 homolog [Clytia hemisphaerica]|uniref:Transmembrane protein 14C n=1 Tax=Clytia hemisphaerica TaxID=252671 RepID=A0A7M5TXZ9_9CNID